WGVDQGATVVIGVPPLLAALARTGPHSGIRIVLSSGQALDPTTEAVLRRGFPKAVLIDFYGTSEQSFIAWRTVGEEATRGTVGRPFAGVEAEIRDAEGRPVATGVQGRLHVKSPMVFDGYLEGLDRGGFSSKDGWSSVGDLGWLGEDGTLTLAGREGGMVVVRGVNVFPQEVEAALKALPGILDAGVVGLPDAGRGALLVALVEGEGGTDPAALAALRPEKRPRRIIGVTALPRTLTGKIDRRALAELAARLITR
ncbi:AMP-dependent synthetase, partial [Rhodospirillum rubrum]|uniref:AMP-binding protein n=1 Tax=Rhodospirillum rubrum TaxID=1085 RepID=UPI001907CC4B